MYKQLTTLILALQLSSSFYAQQLYVGTYNIRYNNPNDEHEGNAWALRCPPLCDFINFEQPEIFGTQEVLVDQLHDLSKGLNGYDYIGIGREDGKEKGEYAAIFYKKDQLRLLDSGNFWLSSTPEHASLGWDAACIRICTWGEFQDKTSGKKFFFFNTHMDHVGVVARRESAQLILKRISQLAKGLPTILTGDFNVDQTDEIYQIFSNSGILHDCYTNAQQRMAPTGTWNDFMQDSRSKSRIDHVFVTRDFDVPHYAIFTNSYWLGKSRRNISDHYPVMVKLSYSKNKTLQK
jgi:endonuclease/exonuclease/phosphatase family protein